VIGTLYVGTSGFSYPGWAPRFYPRGLRDDGLLRHYASRFPAVELNNTYYQQPSAAKVAGWLAATPPAFRFVVKAQRGGTFRLFTGAAEGAGWLTAPLRAFGARLGAVFLRVPGQVSRDDARLDALLAAWPGDLPLVCDFQHPSWHDDEVFDRLRAAGAALCATELPEDDESPTIRLIGGFLYLRLRRLEYAPAELEAWAARLAPFLEAGHDVFVFFRHDETGRATEYAAGLRSAVELGLRRPTRQGR
jgi:uncharacterized protein YecE (DUF72 family)